MIKIAIFLVMSFTSISAFSAESTGRDGFENHDSDYWTYLSIGAAFELYDFTVRQHTLTTVLSLTGTLAPVALAPCIPYLVIAKTCLKAINAVSFLERMLAQVTEHQELISPYNPSPYFFEWASALTVTPLIEPVLTDNHYRAFQDGRRLAAVPIEILNGIYSTWYLYSLGSALWYKYSTDSSQENRLASLTPSSEVLSLSRTLERNIVWERSHLTSIIEAPGLDHRTDIPIIAEVALGRQGSFSDMSALLHISNAEQWSRSPSTYKGFLDVLPRWLENRRGSLGNVRGLFQALHDSGSVSILTTVDTLCNRRSGDVSAVRKVVAAIAILAHPAGPHFEPEYLVNLVNDREGTLHDLNTLLDLRLTPEELNGLHLAFHRRAGDLLDIVTLIRLARYAGNPLTQINTVHRLHPGLPITGLISSLNSLISTRIVARPPVATRTVRGVDPLQVHREAAIRMKPIFEFLNKRLDGTPLLSTAESLQKIKRWIPGTEISHLSENPERDRARMLSLLAHSKWAAALRATYANLGNNVNGELLLRTAATFCSKHPENVNGELLLRTAATFCSKYPENVPLFIHQGLMDSIIAYIDNPESLDNLSCANGIAERFMLCFRNLAPESTLISDFTKSIYNHPEYQHLLNMGEENETEAQKAQWLARYRSIQDLAVLRTTIQGELQQLKTKLQGVAPANTRYAFNTKAIMHMFHMFDDQRNTMEESRLIRIFDAIQGRRKTATNAPNF